MEHPPALLRSESQPERRREVQSVLKAHVPESWKDGPILCLGCGDGYELDIFAALGFKNVHGVTNDEREAQKDPRIFVDDIHDMPRWNAGDIRFIYSKETMEHLVSPWCALLEMNRIMPIGGEFLHLISCGIDKQREIYHVSCFPDWLWFDLMKKAGFRVTKILQGHRTEFGFYGVKERDVAGLEKIDGRYAYDLNGQLADVPRAILQL